MKKKTIISIVSFLIVLYFLFLIIGITSADVGHPEKGFNIVETLGGVLFGFTWALGGWGYILLATIFILLFLLINWIVGKLIKKV